MNPTNADITPGLLLRSTEHGEVMVLAAPVNGRVHCEAFRKYGHPYTTMVKKSSLRWQ